MLRTILRRLFSGAAPAQNDEGTSALETRPAPGFNRETKQILKERLGPYVTHCTAAQNVPFIQKHGLLSAAAIARMTGKDTHSIAMRDKRLILENSNIQARLNNQKPLLAGLNNAGSALDGHSLKSWAMQLDERVFLWPGSSDNAFASSLDRTVSLKTIVLNTDVLLEATSHHLWLCPINSGAFLRKPAHRGDWIYVSAHDGWDTYRSNRHNRGLISGYDTKVKELSLTCSLPPNRLAAMIEDIQ